MIVNNHNKRPRRRGFLNSRNIILHCWLRKATAYVEEHWEVYCYDEYNQASTAGCTTAPLNPERQAYQKATNIVVRSYHKLSAILEEHYTKLDGLFDRIILDESQSIQHKETKKLNAICAFNARFRHCYTATIIFNDLNDIILCLKFMGRDEWTLNYSRDHYIYDDTDNLTLKRSVSKKIEQGKWRRRLGRNRS